MRIVFAGTPEVALPSLRALAASRHDLVGVVTRPDAQAGRGRRLVASPVAILGEELGIPVLKPASPKDPSFQDELRALAPDWATRVDDHQYLVHDGSLRTMLKRADVTLIGFREIREAMRAALPV